MTRHQYTKNIYNELKVLNERIDYKILRGQRYTDESLRRKTLLRQIARQSKRGLISKLFSFA